MMNRYFVVARGSTYPRCKTIESSFETLRRANYQRDDREREIAGRSRAARTNVPATYDRTRYIDPAE